MIVFATVVVDDILMIVDNGGLTKPLVQVLKGNYSLQCTPFTFAFYQLWIPEVKVHHCIHFFRERMRYTCIFLSLKTRYAAAALHIL